jgi:excisionase family DNA binding protein
MSRLLTIKQAADILGVSTKTIRRWEENGKISSMRTAGGHRRFKDDDLSMNINKSVATIAYARINRNQSQEQLNQQVFNLETYCQERGWNCEIIKDCGSGVEYSSKGLARLMKLICAKKIERLVLSNKNRLLTIGSDLIFTLCEIFGVEVVIINSAEEVCLEEDLNSDLEDIIRLFNARLYGSRNSHNGDLVRQLQQITQSLSC